MDVEIDQAGRYDQSGRIDNFGLRTIGFRREFSVDEKKIGDFVAFVRRIDDAAIANNSRVHESEHGRPGCAAGGRLACRLAAEAAGETPAGRTGEDALCSAAELSRPLM
jgi:hypothetical protein